MIRSDKSAERSKRFNAGLPLEFNHLLSNLSPYPGNLLSLVLEDRPPMELCFMFPSWKNLGLTPTLPLSLLVMINALPMTHSCYLSFINSYLLSLISIQECCHENGLLTHTQLHAMTQIITCFLFLVLPDPSIVI